jgi:hypothetical protein
MIRCAVLAIAGLGSCASGPNGEAAEKFQKLTGTQIRAKFIGMEMTDNVHFADVFGANGGLRTYSMGRKQDGKWRVEKDELCVDRGKDDGGCYQVWVSGKNVEFRRAGLPDWPSSQFLDLDARLEAWLRSRRKAAASWPSTSS